MSLKSFKNKCFLDGAKGTEISSRGYTKYPIDYASIDAVEIVEQVHQSYIDSGVDVITTNTFRVTSFPDKSKMKDVICADCSLIKNLNAPNIALSIGPGDGDFSDLTSMQRKELKQKYKWQAELATDCQVDMIVLETVCSLDEAVMAIEEILSITSIPLCVTCTLTEKSTMLSGETLDQFSEKMESLGVFAIGLNCIPISKLLLNNVKELAKKTSLPLIIQPNLGMPEQTKNGAEYPVKEKEFFETMQAISEINQVKFLGGCCGTTPKLMTKLIELKVK